VFKKVENGIPVGPEIRLGQTPDQREFGSLGYPMKALPDLLV